MNDGNKFAITVNYGQSPEDIVGKLEWVPSDLNPKINVYKDILDQYVIVPSFIVNEDGTKEVVGWSLILGRNYKFPFEEEKSDTQ